MANPIVNISTNKGDLRLELYPEIAPLTVANYIKLAQSGFYNGLTFHRVISGFMAQGGCPEGDGTGDPGWNIKGEFSANGVENNLSHTRGVISMARASDPDSAGCQFFIVHDDSAFLDGNYAAFGKLVDGYPVLDAICEVKTNRSDAPLDDVTINGIIVEL
ncbi:MAG: peptidylprolyl isomerase [Oscillospiraceae bacterium]|jgi:peptidyl-prolyl cis-trans isomerase B (cyclophilin B)|nr:peptidylprolyl isomerase [Oscillospiraceae bacterium]